MSHALINLQAIPTVLCLLLILLRSGSLTPVATAFRPPLWLCCLLIVAASLALFARTLALPLTHDSCGLVYIASQQSAAAVGHLFRPPPTSPDFFFRPLAYTAFWIYAKWAGFHPFRWNAWCLTLHIINALLLYTLARRLDLHRLSALTAGLLFATHGTRAEAVAWPAVRVDLLACFFVLLSLILVEQLSKPSRSPWLYPLLALTASAAFLSKEAAFALPFMAAALLYAQRESRKLPVLSLLFTTAGVCFCYRLWVLGGIGGYGATQGNPAALHFNAFRLVEALFYRQWAFLFFPINWSRPPGITLAIGLVLMAALLVALSVLWVPAGRRRLAAFLALTVAAALPAYQLLFLGPDLNGARVLYLPVVGVALFWAAVLQGQHSNIARYSILGGLLFFQAAALAHNLSLWRDVSFVAQRAYQSIAAELVHLPGQTVAVENLPATHDGVFFLSNSFPACVLVNSQNAMTSLPAIDQVPTGAPLDRYAAAWRWNDATLRFDRLK